MKRIAVEMEGTRGFEHLFREVNTVLQKFRGKHQQGQKKFSGEKPWIEKPFYNKSEYRQRGRWHAREGEMLKYSNFFLKKII